MPSKIEEKEKNKVRSISLPSYQVKFLDYNPNFSLSKFVQLHLKEYIDLVNSTQINNNDKKTIK